jgi:hypothetical protein
MLSLNIDCSKVLQKAKKLSAARISSMLRDEIMPRSSDLNTSGYILNQFRSTGMCAVF